MKELVDAVLAGRKYRDLQRNLVERVAAQELAKLGKLQEKGQHSSLVKAIRGRLHQSVCAYQAGSPDYDRWLANLRAAAGDADALVSACRAAMAGHASTRERLPILEPFYRELLPAGLTDVVDVGCGLNPLAIPWMRLAPGARYRAYDVVGDLVALLSQALPLLGVRGTAELTDLTGAPGQLDVGAELALALKLLPCLDQLEAGSGESLLTRLTAPLIAVSFPTRTLGGARKGLGRTYETGFVQLVERQGWRILRRVELPGELAFLVAR